jgi:hypothetical protein
MRFRRIIALTQRNSTTGSKMIIKRLSYFKDMNLMISFAMFMYGASMTILCADGLTEAKIINSSKFGTDTIIANMNICVVVLLLSLVSVYILFYFFGYT